MMIVADSGSTKCDWRLVPTGEKARANGGVRAFSSIGFNPFFHDEAFIEAEIRKVLELANVAESVTQVFFYCAGGSSDELRNKAKRGLARVFVNAQIMVDHDLKAAAYSVFTGEPCIAAIMGTGSNSCFIDRSGIREEVPALAYILGDEGSGSYYGKILLRKFLYRQLPEHLHNCLAEQYDLTKATIFENVYMKPNANVYLASVMKMVSLYKDDPFIQDMISEGMNRFLTEHVCCFAEHKDVKTHFVGSIGYYFEQQLREQAAMLGVNVGTIAKKPIDGLVQYHLQAEHA